MENTDTRTLNHESLIERRRHAAVLVLYHMGRTRVVPLVPGRPVVVGRAHECDVRLEDDTISRHHTRFAMEGDTIWVEDLQSKNGTLVGGKRVERGRISPDDRVTIGAATGFIHIHSPIVEPSAGVETHEQFIAALDDALRRAQASEQKLAVVFLLTNGQADPADWFPAVATHTRPYDRLAAYSPAAAEILLWDTDREGASGLVQQLLQHRRLARLSPLCGIAAFPGPARSAEEMIEHARQAAVEATRVQAGEPPTAAAAPASTQPVVASAAMREVFNTARHLARSNIPVLLVGETGTGKELVARAIHENGERRSGPMVCINCAAIPATLIESELFGHERGAFTGAERRAKGLFEEADGGTVLLDEIGELSPGAQAALLRVLETKRFSRVGSKKEIEVDVRVVAATHRNLESMCKEGSFRMDLLYRVNAMTVVIPPLRDRVEEIGPLTEHFLRTASSCGAHAVTHIAPEALALLQQYPWPGNVRELRNVIERGVALANGPAIEVAHLPARVLELGGGSLPPRPSPQQGPPPTPATRLLPQVVLDLIEGPRGLAADDFRGFIQRTEAALIVAALRADNGNKAATARTLGIPLRTLKEKVRAFGISGTSEPDAELLRALEAVAPGGPRATASFKERIRSYEAALISWALETAGGSRTAAAEKLRIPLRTLRDKVHAYGLGD